MLYKLLWILFYIHLSEQFIDQYQTAIPLLNNDPMDEYCAAFTSCTECKEAGPQCDWCHEIGCTRFPNYHCPQKLFLDKTYKKNVNERFCTEIISDGPVFIPAMRKKFITLNLRIDDLTLYNRDLLCEIHLEDAVLRVRATISESMVYCDMTILRITRSVSLGYVRVFWGGADPLSNILLLIVYKCEYMATNCVDCQVLNKQFDCGWCEDINGCTLIEECPERFGGWLSKKSQCAKYKAPAVPLLRPQPNEIIVNVRP